MIFILKEGRVAESGTHEQLCENGKTYREIFNASARGLSLAKISKPLETIGLDQLDIPESGK